MPTDLRSITDFEGLLAYLGSELDWPVENYTREELTFEYDADELGLKEEEVAKLSHGSIQQLRPLQGQQPFGIFFVEFDHAKLPIVVLRRILSQLVIKKRSSANSAEAKRWEVSDLIFISAFGEEEHREIAFAHFHSDSETTDLPVLRVLGWHGDDTQLKSAAVAKTLKNRLSWPEDDGDQEAWRQQWRSAFKHRPGHTISTSKELATAMAGFAKRIRDAARAILPYESENGRLRKLYKGFQDALIHDLSEEDFTTYYAETICYGLFTVAVSRTELSEGKYGTAMSADDVAHFVPVTNPFLKEMLWSFLEAGGRNQELNFDDLGINEIVSFFNSSETDLPAVIRDFGSKRPGEDPVIHLYEDFLKQFDAELRKKRGVYYTPKPVVSYIVRSVHELLQTEFELVDGLADTTTWGEMLGKHAGLELPTTFDDKNREQPISQDEPFVQILDPATGTATFLVEVIDVIHKHLVAKWKQQGLAGAQQLSAWNDYVPQHLLPRLHGYELMMAPYAIAHMKIGLKLAETGYRFATEERVRIYLTNALDSWVKQLPLIGFAALAQEADSVNKIKRYKRFSVVIGNPPYASISSNMGAWASELIEDFKYVDGVHFGEVKHWLHDDYVKFVRLAYSVLMETGYGTCGVITNRGFLSGPTFRGMRCFIWQNSSSLKLLDLHGGAIQEECDPPAGVIDENVFDIKQGVAILISTLSASLPATSTYVESWGLRKEKFSQLEGRGSNAGTGVNLASVAPRYDFIPSSDAELDREYSGFVGINELFPVGSTGIQTSRDSYVITFEKAVLEQRFEEFCDHNLADSFFRKKYDLSDGRNWSLLGARSKLKSDNNWRSTIVRCQFRPLDFRWMIYHPSVINWPRPDVMPHMLQRNISLVVPRNYQGGKYDAALVSRFVTEVKTGEATRGSYCYPLYLYDKDCIFFGSDLPRPNIDESHLAQLAENFQLAFISNGAGDLNSNFGPEDIQNYVYATLYSQGYRDRYSNLIRNGFPRLPLTNNVELFCSLVPLGCKLTALHLMESPTLDEPFTEFIGKNRQVSKVGWTPDEGGTVWLDGKGSGEKHKPGTSGFQGVPEEVWNFHIGGYQVCEKWLKDRGAKKGQPGRTLTDEDIAHYHKIVVALTETIRLMAEIDEVIESHGGWPGAFSAKAQAAT